MKVHFKTCEPKRQETFQRFNETDDRNEVFDFFGPFYAPLKTCLFLIGVTLLPCVNVHVSSGIMAAARRSLAAGWRARRTSRGRDFPAYTRKSTQPANLDIPLSKRGGAADFGYAAVSISKTSVPWLSDMPGLNAAHELLPRC